MKSIFYRSCPNYNTITHRLTRNKLLFPHLFADSFGKSVWGKNLWCAGVGNLQNPLLVVGGLHGRDSIGILSCFALLEYLLGSDDPYLQSRLTERGVLIVPCLNPDGLALWWEGVLAAPDPQRVFDLCGGDVTRWRGNANGVNLHTDFAATQPETAALQDLCSRHKPQRAVCLQNGKDAILAPEGDTAGKIMSFLSGYPLYTPNQSPGGGYSNIVGCPVYTVCQGDAQNPLPDFDRLGQKCLPQLLALLCLPV